MFNKLYNDDYTLDDSIMVGGVTNDIIINTSTNLQLGTLAKRQLTTTILDMDLDEYDIKGEVLTWEQNDVVQGIFTVTDVTKTNDSKYKLTLEDNTTNFEQDATDWFLEDLSLPMTVKQILEAVASRLSTTIVFSDTTNYTFVVERNAYIEDVTYKDIVEYCLEIMCCFGVHGADGKLYVRFYEESNIEITNDDYTTQTIDETPTALIDKVQIKTTDDDVGVIVGTGSNAYIVQNNAFLYGGSISDLETVANNILEKLEDIVYYEAEIKSYKLVEIGDIFTLTTRLGSYTCYAMETYCTGSGTLQEIVSIAEDERQEVSTVNKILTALNNKTTELQVDLDGFRVETSENIETISGLVETNTASLEIVSDKIETAATSKSTVHSQAPDLYIVNDLMLLNKPIIGTDFEFESGVLYICTTAGNNDGALTYKHSGLDSYVTSDGYTLTCPNIVASHWERADDYTTTEEVQTTVTQTASDLMVTLQTGGLQSNARFSEDGVEIYNADFSIYSGAYGSTNNEKVFGIDNDTGYVLFTGRLGDFVSTVNGKIGSFELESNEGVTGTYEGLAIYDIDTMLGALYTTGSNLNYKSFGDFSIFNNTYQSLYLGSTGVTLRAESSTYLTMVDEQLTLRATSSCSLYLYDGGANLIQSSNRYLSMVDSSCVLMNTTSNLLSLSSDLTGLLYSTSRYLYMTSDSVILQTTSNRYFYAYSGTASELSIGLRYNSSTNLKLTSSRCDITGSLYVNSIQVTSDRSKKRNIKELEFSALEKLQNHKFYSYDVAAEDADGNEIAADHNELGLMTDECAEECVRTDESGSYIDMEAQMALMTKAIQELYAIVQKGNKS